jgi:TonB family protein
VKRSAFSPLAILLAAGLSAAPASGHEPFRTWLTQRIDARIYYPSAAARAAESGVVTILFELNENRRPVGARIARSSGSRALDRAALETVATMPAAPVGSPAGPHAVVLEYNAAGKAMKEAARREAVRTAGAYLDALRTGSARGGR